MARVTLNLRVQGERGLQKIRTGAQRVGKSVGQALSRIEKVGPQFSLSARTSTAATERLKRTTEGLVSAYNRVSLASRKAFDTMVLANANRAQTANAAAVNSQAGTAAIQPVRTVGQIVPAGAIRALNKLDDSLQGARHRVNQFRGAIAENQPALQRLGRGILNLASRPFARMRAAIGRNISELGKYDAALDKNAGAHRRNGVAAAASAKDQRRQAQGVGQVTNNTGRTFSALSKTITDGLVPAYATLAATLFAVSAAFEFLQKAGDLRILREGQITYASAVGTSVRTLTEDLIRATDAQLDFETASQGAAIGVASGLTNEQLEGLAAGARNASILLGRNLPDAFNRLVRGTTKAEAELLDELGIFARLGPATEKYAAALGISASSLNEFQRTQAFANEVLDQLDERFTSIIGPVEANVNAITQLGVAFQKTFRGVRLLIEFVIRPLAELLTQFESLRFLFLTVFGGKLIGSVLSNFGSIGTFITGLNKRIAITTRNTQANAIKIERALDRTGRTVAQREAVAVTRSRDLAGRAATFFAQDIRTAPRAATDSITQLSKVQNATAEQAKSLARTVNTEFTRLQKSVGFQSLSDSAKMEFNQIRDSFKNTAQGITQLSRDVTKAQRTNLSDIRKAARESGRVLSQVSPKAFPPGVVDSFNAFARNTKVTATEVANFGKEYDRVVNNFTRGNVFNNLAKDQRELVRSTAANFANLRNSLVTTQSNFAAAQTAAITQLQQQAAQAGTFFQRAVPAVSQKTIDSFRQFSQVQNATLADTKRFQTELGRALRTIERSGTSTQLNDALASQLRGIERGLQGSVTRISRLGSQLTDVQQRNVVRLQAQSTSIANFLQNSTRGNARVLQQRLREFSQNNNLSIKEVDRLVSATSRQLNTIAQGRQFEQFSASTRQQFRAIERSWTTTVNRLNTSTLGFVDRALVRMETGFLRVRQAMNSASIAAINFTKRAALMGNAVIGVLGGLLQKATILVVIGSLLLAGARSLGFFNKSIIESVNPLELANDRLSSLAESFSKFNTIQAQFLSDEDRPRRYTAYFRNLSNLISDIRIDDLVAGADAQFAEVERRIDSFQRGRAADAARGRTESPGVGRRRALREEEGLATDPVGPLAQVGPSSLFSGGDLRRFRDSQRKIIDTILNEFDTNIETNFVANNFNVPQALLDFRDTLIEIQTIPITTRQEYEALFGFLDQQSGVRVDGRVQQELAAVQDLSVQYQGLEKQISANADTFSKLSSQFLPISENEAYVRSLREELQVNEDISALAEITNREYTEAEQIAQARLKVFEDIVEQARLEQQIRQQLNLDRERALIPLRTGQNELNKEYERGRAELKEEIRLQDNRFANIVNFLELGKATNEERAKAIELALFESDIARAQLDLLTKTYQLETRRARTAERNRSLSAQISAASTFAQVGLTQEQSTGVKLTVEALEAAAKRQNILEQIGDEEARINSLVDATRLADSETYQQLVDELAINTLITSNLEQRVRLNESLNRLTERRAAEESALQAIQIRSTAGTEGYQSQIIGFENERLRLLFDQENAQRDLNRAIEEQGAAQRAAEGISRELDRLTRERDSYLNVEQPVPQELSTNIEAQQRALAGTQLRASDYNSAIEAARQRADIANAEGDALELNIALFTRQNALQLASERRTQSVDRERRRALIGLTELQTELVKQDFERQQILLESVTIEEKLNEARNVPIHQQNPLLIQQLENQAELLRIQNDELDRQVNNIFRIRDATAQAFESGLQDIIGELITGVETSFTDALLRSVQAALGGTAEALAKELTLSIVGQDQATRDARTAATLSEGMISAGRTTAQIWEASITNAIEVGVGNSATQFQDILGQSNRQVEEGIDERRPANLQPQEIIVNPNMAQRSFDIPPFELAPEDLIPQGAVERAFEEPLNNITTGFDSIFTGFQSVFSGFTNFFGGIASSLFGGPGIIPFNRGGIVTRPTVSLIGEGGQNEAVVPLPGGRSIPVDFSGAAGGGMVNNVSVNVNIDNQGQATTSTSGGENLGARIGEAVSLAVRREIHTQTRPGGSLSKYGVA